MVQILQANKVNLRNLIDRFQIQQVDDEQFFPEWQTDLPEISEQEKQALDKIRRGYFHLLQSPPLLERTVQLSVLAPLFFLADFYLPPFEIQTEQSIEIQEEDEDVIIRGQLDIVLLREGFWIVVIESKRSEFSVEAGIAQLLAYSLASPPNDRPVYGLVTTGGEFLFTKLLKSPSPKYGTSNQFVLRRKENELYDVFRILKRLAQL
jgi:hypothetical protein